MRAVRILLGLIGVAAGVYGGRLLLDQGGENLRATGTWLIGGVILHDGIFGPAVLAASAVAAYAVRGRLRGPLIVGAVVLVTVTVVAIPVLGRFGAKPDNPTLLDRNYVAGWFVFAALVIGATAVALVRGQRERSSPVEDPVSE